jgi:transposase
MKYLALDAHSDFCTLGVLSEDDKVLFCIDIETSEVSLISAIQNVSDPKILVVEESPLAHWIRRTLKPYLNEFIVSAPRENTWISRVEDKNDPNDTIRLARLLKGGFIKEVYHTDDDQRQDFKELILHYHDTTKQITRFKNKIKAKFRQHGIQPKKRTTVYNPKNRQCWLEKLESQKAVFILKNLYSALDSLRSIQVQNLKQLRKLAKRYHQIKKFQKLPGVGFIIEATFFAIVDTPDRFINKHKLWCYSSLAKTERISAGKILRKGASNNGNRLLKYIVIEAAKNAARKNMDNKFSKKYSRLIRQGVSPANAQRTVGRSILATMYSLWLTGGEYIES